MQNKENKQRKQIYLKASLFAGLFLVMGLVLWLNWDFIWSLIENSDNLRDWVLQWETVPQVVFILVQVVQVVLFVIPGEVPQIAGGLIFGTLGGSLLSTLGIAIGATINFFLARTLARPLIEHLLKKQNQKQLDSLLKISAHPAVLFFLFLIPGLPFKDLLCYISGLTPLSYPVFIFISSLGRLPGIIGSALIGDAAVQNQWPVVIAVTVTAAVLFGLGFLFQKKIVNYLLNRFKRDEP
jgi:uncharacterized membrane protein YdjX (TVP38/TMEM64 family)